MDAVGKYPLCKEEGCINMAIWETLEVKMWRISNIWGLRNEGGSDIASGGGGGAVKRSTERVAVGILGDTQLEPSLAGKNGAVDGEIGHRQSLSGGQCFVPARTPDQWSKN